MTRYCLNRDRGSLATELAASIPIIMVLMMLVVVANRAVTVRQDVDSVAEAAARAASLQRDPGAAWQAADQAARANLGDGRTTCNPLLVEVDTSAFEPGGRVDVSISCIVDNSLLAMGFPVPGTVTVSSHATSPIDTWRGAP